MLYPRMMIIFFLTGFCFACSEDPVANDPNANSNNEMGQADSGMLPDLTDPMDPDSAPDSDMPSAARNAQRLVIQPVSGSGIVKGAKFKAHIQVGRLIDVSPGK